MDFVEVQTLCRGGHEVGQFLGTSRDGGLIIEFPFHGCCVEDDVERERVRKAALFIAGRGWVHFPRRPFPKGRPGITSPMDLWAHFEAL